MKFKAAFFSGLIIVSLSAFKNPPKIKGVWIYAGEFFNGKRSLWNEDYKLQRRYDEEHFKSYIIEKGAKPVLYQSGDYKLIADTCMETETYSTQPSQLTGKTIHYQYSFHQDTLILKGNLPNGKYVEEYWKKSR